MRHKYALLLVLIVLVVAGWTGAWFWVRDRVVTGMDQAISDLAADGVLVDCPDRAAIGWPFRLEVSCRAAVVRLPDGSRAEVDAVAATGHIMDPRLVIVELNAPAKLLAPDGTAAIADFSSMRASLRFGDDRISRISAEADDLVVEAGPDGTEFGRLAADHGEVHLRAYQEIPGTAELVMSLSGATGTAANGPLLPAPADAGVDALVSDVHFLDGTPQGLAAWARSGGRIDLRQVVLELGETRLGATGTGTVTEDGRINAKLEATANGIAWLTGQASAGKSLPPALAALASAFLLIGKPVEGQDGARRVIVEVDEGAVTANGLPVATVPPAF